MDRPTTTDQPGSRSTADPNEQEDAVRMILRIAQQKNQENEQRDGVGEQVMHTAVQERAEHNPAQSGYGPRDDAELLEGHMKKYLSSPDQEQCANNHSADDHGLGEIGLRFSGHGLLLVACEMANANQILYQDAIGVALSKFQGL